MKQFWVQSRPKKKLTSNIEGDRVADAVTLEVVGDAGVDAGLLPLHPLQDEDVLGVSAIKSEVLGVSARKSCGSFTFAGRGSGST